MNQNQPDPEKPASSSRIKKPSTCCCLSSSMLGLVLIALTVLFIIGINQAMQSPRKVEVYEPPNLQPEKYTLSEEQVEVTSEFGWPSSFVILFYTIKGEDGQPIDVRDETWTYHDLRTSFQFINGQFTVDNLLPDDAPPPQPIPYTPENFTAGMDLESLVASAKLQRYLQIPLEEELIPGGDLYYANMLTFGIKDGEVRYVETLALESEVQP